MAHADETGTVRGDWVRFIYATARITDSTRVLMLALSEAMDETGRVEATRDEVANLLSRAPRRVSARYTDAIEAGVIEQIQRGNRKTGSVFQALIPNGEQMTHGEHMFPRKHVTEPRPLSQETSDPRGTHVSKETYDPRPSPIDPNTCPPGVTSSAAPIREGIQETSPQSLFEVPEAPEPNLSPQALKRSQNKRVNALATVYYDAVNRMGNWDAIRSVIKKAVAADYTNEQIERGLKDVASGTYPLTANTLRIAIDRTSPRPELRAVSGGYQPYKNPTNQDAYDEELI